MLYINVNDPQPLPCPKCKEKEGYQYSDYISLHYTTYHAPNGKHEGGFYSESPKMINQAKEAYCSNCGKKLPFRVNRSRFEDVS